MANANSGITVQFGVGSPLVLITTAQTTGTEWTQISGTFVAAGAASTKFYVFTTFQQNVPRFPSSPPRPRQPPHYPLPRNSRRYCC